MFHCKYLVIDGKFVSVGSTNFDQRSFRLNDECNLNVFDEGLATEMLLTFEDDKIHSELQTRDMWNERPLYEKTANKLAALISGQV